MQKQKCLHSWEMTNVASGLIVMKKCFHCGRVSTCFTFHNEPPVETYHEGAHFWNFMEGDESFHFDLRCSKCSMVVKLDELVGLMRCTGCDPDCDVCILKEKIEPEAGPVYIACGRRPVDERRQLPKEKIASLQEFFDQRCKSMECKIKVVPHEMVRNVAKCYAEPVKDVDMLFAAVPEGG